MKRLLLILLCLVAPLRAANWYLDDDAVGSANGTSWTNAWTNTTAIVWSSINSGDTLWVRPGNYGRLLVDNEDGVNIKIDPSASTPAYFGGTDSSFIYSSDDVLIDGLVGSEQYLRFTGQDSPTTENTEIILLKSCRRVTLRGLHLSRQAYFDDELAPVIGIFISNSTKPANEDITIEDSYIGYVTGDGVNINEPGPAEGWDHYMIRRCTIFNTGDDGVQHSGNATLLYNNIDQNGEDSLFNAHPDGVQTGRWCKYIRIEGNTFKSYTQNIFAELALGHVRIINNTMTGVRIGSSERGMLISCPNSPYVFEGQYVLANNTFYNFRSFNAIHGGGSVERNVPAIDRYFGNNIFVNCKQLMGSAWNELLDSTNIYYDLPGVQYYTTDGTPVSPPADRQSGASVYADPRLNDPASGDFTLEEGSPAIGIGTNFSDWFTTDKNGDTRPAEPTAWDGGVFMYDAGSAPADVTAPTLTSAEVNATELVLTFSESVFHVSAAHYALSGGQTLGDGSVDLNVVRFTVTPAVQYNATVTLAYTSGAGRTDDAAGNLLATFSGTAVTNRTPSPSQPGRKGRGVLGRLGR